MFPNRLQAWSLRALNTLALIFVAAHACGASTYYVSPAGSDSHAGTITAPFQTIQHAVDATVSNDTIVLGDGTYTGPGDVDVVCSHVINIQSINGAAKTIIDCAGEYQGLTLGVINGSVTILKGVTIENGYGSIGGAVYIGGGSVEIDDCVFIGNEATQGGAVDTYCSVGTVTIKNCTFTNNSSYGGGGSAITVLDGNAFTLQNCHLTGNTAHATAGRDDDGGAVKIRLTRLSSIIDCVFGGNSCVNSNGGAISNGAGDLTIRDCTFYANAAVDGGAIYSTSTGWYGNKIEYSTFVNNSASTSAGAIYNAVNVETTLTDDILWGDNAPTGPEIANFGTLTATYSDIATGMAGTGNIVADPLFVDGESGDLHLQPGSPCTAAGTYIAGINADLDGVARSSHPTMGAYEAAPPAPVGLTAIGGGHAVKLSWSKPPSATRYDLYRASASGGEGSVPYRSGITATAFLDTGLTNGVAYYYQVSAVNAAGTGPKSVEVHATPSTPRVIGGGTDFQTKGNWKDRYGAEGYWVCGDTSANNPHFSNGISVTPGPHNSGVYSGSLLAPIFLQKAASGGTERVGGVWFQTSWTININVVGTHTLAFYVLDRSTTGLVETITFTDPATGAEICGGGASMFGDGRYEVFSISGNVNVTFTSLTGHWAVLNGIFFGGSSGLHSPAQPTGVTASQVGNSVALAWKPSTGATSYNVYRGTTSGGESTTPLAKGIKTISYSDTTVRPNTTYYYEVVAVNSYCGSFTSGEASATVLTSRAAFVKTDTTTQGSWKGIYGADGFNVIGDTSTGNAHYPSYATVTPGPHLAGLWADSSTAENCLQSVADGSTNRVAGVWYQTLWSVNLNVTGTHQLALYLLDFPNAGYAETITIKDAATGVVLDTRSASSLTGGVYEVWNVSGDIVVTLTSTSTHWAVLSGFFFQ